MEPAFLHLMMDVSIVASTLMTRSRGMEFLLGLTDASMKAAGKMASSMDKLLTRTRRTR